MHGRFCGKKPSSITILIEKNEDGNLTKAALLYQDILKYSSEVIEFNRYGLTDWLLHNNSNLINYYKSLDKRNLTKANRIRDAINNRKDGVQFKIDDLVQLQIVEKYRTSINQKKVNVQYYRLTNFGKLLFFLIDYHAYRDNDIQRTKLVESIYDLLTTVKELKNSNALFNFYFFRTLKEWNSFEYFVSRLTNTLFTTDILYNERDLMEKARDPTVMDDLWEIRKEALAESYKKLEPEMKKYYLFNLKSILEAQERKIARNFDHYEKLAFSNRNDYESFVKEIECPSCNTYSSMVFSLSEIMERSNGKEKYKCPNCNERI